MEIIAVANEKGGVAKTTTSVSLGGALAELGKDVLLIDLDTQANLTLSLGISPGKLRRSVADVLLSSATIVGVSRESGVDGLDIVPSSPAMGIAERFLPRRNGYEFILKTALQSLLSYDYVIIDCPPSLGAVTLNALTAANRVITPTQPEYFSVYGLRSVLGLIRKVRGLNLPNIQSQTTSSDLENLDHSDNGTEEGVQSRIQGSNPNLVYHILITIMDRRNRIHRTLKEQLKQTFSDGLLNTVIEIDTKLRESTVMGQPINIYSPKTRSASQYRALAEEIHQYAKEKTAE
jgi:chromosome partitioning protein